MNRLLKDYLGDMPIFKRDAMKLVDNFETDAYVVDGIVRWKSNDRIPPEDILELWNYVEKPFNYEKSLSVKSHETSIFFQNYAESMKNYVHSAEEMSEMRNAFGAGTKVVDVITGDIIQL